MRLWVECINNNDGFWAVPIIDSNELKPGSANEMTNGWKNFQAKKIDTKKAIRLGPSCPKTARGVFHFQTNAVAPFAKGKDGITHSSEFTLFGFKSPFRK